MYKLSFRSNLTIFYFHFTFIDAVYLEYYFLISLCFINDQYKNHNINNQNTIKNHT
jgi:hypothetical protein